MNNNHSRGCHYQIKDQLAIQIVTPILPVHYPHYEENLRPLSGLDLAVGRHIEADSAYAPFFANLKKMLVSLLPAYEREGKSYLTIAVGCTGGRHRSVFVAERVAEALQGSGRQVGVRHREMADRN